MQHPSDASKIVYIEDDLDDTYMSMVYCESKCYDEATYAEW
jgi:hypothetical protein